LKKYSLIALIVVFMSVMGFAQNGTSSLKVGYVNSETILNQYPVAIKAQGELDALVTLWQAQLDSMAQDLEAGIESYQKQAATMPQAKKDETQAQLVKKQQDLENFRKVKFTPNTGEIYAERAKLMRPIMDKVYAAIEAVSKEEGMQFVFDKATDAFLLYADGAFDVTFKVLDRLKRGN